MIEPVKRSELELSRMSKERRAQMVRATLQDTYNAMLIYQWTHNHLTDMNYVASVADTIRACAMLLDNTRLGTKRKRRMAEERAANE